jgi:hypothetical protein
MVSSRAQKGNRKYKLSHQSTCEQKHYAVLPPQLKEYVGDFFGIRYAYNANGEAYVYRQTKV